MNKIKLKPKTLAALNKIQSEKAQLSKIFQELNAKESMILEFVFEENGVTVEEVTSVSLDTDSITYDYKTKTEPKTKKRKEKIVTE